MKKLFSILLCLLLMFVLVGCGGSSNDTSSDSSSSTENSKESDQSEDKSDALTLGETGEINGISFTINSGQLMDKGVVDDPHFNPPEGRKSLLLNITITNNSDEGFKPYLGEYWIVSENTEINETNIGQDDDITLGSVQDMAPGETATGTISFQVPANAEDYELFIAPEMVIDKEDAEALEFNLKPDQFS